MKKFLKIIACLALAAIMAASFAGCAKSGGNGPSASLIPFPIGTDGNMSGLLLYDEDLYVQIGEKRLYAGGDAQTLVKDLESAGFVPLTVDEAESCLFDGKDITYHYVFGDVFTFPAEDGSGNIVDEIYVTASGAKSKGGLKVGDPRFNVTAVLGAGIGKGDNMICYTLSGDSSKVDEEKQLYFCFENGVVAGIGLLANLYHVDA